MLLVACVPVQEPVFVPEPVFEVLPSPEPPPVQRAVLLGNVNDYVIEQSIPPYLQVSVDAIYDRFAIIPVERYDVRYQHDLDTVLVRLFRFSTREELDVVLNSEFYQIINLGAYYYKKNSIAMFLTPDDHRVALWSSGTLLVYVETFGFFAAREIIDAYLAEYPSDLETTRCIDPDGDDHHFKGNTTRVKIGATFVQWTDICLRDFDLYHNKTYLSRKGLSRADGLLEGRCEKDPYRPGFIDEYACPRSCLDGVCV